MMLEVDWRTNIIDYILNERLFANKTEAEHIARRSKDYVLVRNKFYKRGSHLGVLMKCVSHEEGKSFLEEIHEGN